MATGLRLRRQAERFFDRDYDLVVVGSGAGALGAVRAGRWVGARVLLVADRPVVADSTFTGPVPTAALIAAARRGASFAQATARAREALELVAAGKGADVLRREGIDVIEARARFARPGVLGVEGREVRCGRIVIAGGARPRWPGIPGLDQIAVSTAFDLAELRDPPASMAVIGGGPRGCELAQALGLLGVAITLFERGERILADEEAEASAIVRDAMARSGIDVREGVEVTSIELVDGGRRARVGTAAGPVVAVERVLVATGLEPEVPDLDLDVAGIRRDEAGFIVVDDRLRTTAPGTYAVGDVTGGCPMPHAAFEMGRLAAGHALRKGERGPFRAERIPRLVDTDPQVARIGRTEAQASRRSRVAVLPMAEVDRARLEQRTEGYVKLVTGPRPLTRRLFGGRLVGATVVGGHAGEMIAEVALAMRAGLFAGRLAQSPHPYPTWGSGLQRCAAQFVVQIEGRRARRVRR